MTNTAIIPVVAAAMMDAKGQILLQRRPDGTALAGLWEFPGGKIEGGEGPEAALARELSEEIGVRVSLDDVQPAGFSTAPLEGRHLVLLLYIVRRWQGVPTAIEAPDLRWLDPAELVDMPMPPADIALIEPLLRTIGGVARPGAALPASVP